VTEIPGAGPIKPDEPAPQAEPGFGAVPAAQQQQQPPVRVASGPPLEIPPAMRQDAPPPVRQEPVVSREPAPAPVRQEPPVVAREEPAAAAVETPAVPAFSDVAALVQSLPTEEEPRPAPARATPTRPAAAPARTAPTRTAPARTAPARTVARTPARPAPPPHPSRHWVQVANGDRSAFAFQLGRLRQTAPDLLRTRTAYWARNGGSARLLVGPFDTAAEARAFVNQLSRQHISAFPWTSDAGEEVARLPAR
jgi:hypothetical protein